MKKKRLMTPGPVDVSPDVLLESAFPIPHHRTKIYREKLRKVCDGLKYVLQTNGNVLILTSSGTGAMESAICNLTSPGEKIAVVSNGAFGERWVDIANAYNLEIEHICGEWGYSADLEKLDDILKKDKSIQFVFGTLCETSTGVDQPVKDIASIVKKHSRYLIIDAISGAGAVPLKMDEWGVDLVVAGSQKAFMVPPGLAFVAINNKILKKTEDSRHPKFYFSYKKMLKAWNKEEFPDTPFTSAISLVLQLALSLENIKKEGIENKWGYHKKLAEMTREKIKKIGLELFAKNNHSSTLTSVTVPEGIDGSILVREVQSNYGVTIAGGQKKLKGKIFRIGHIGYVDELDIVATIYAVESTIKKISKKALLHN